MINCGDFFCLLIYNMLFYLLISFIGVMGGAIIAIVNNFYLKDKNPIYDLFIFYSNSFIIAVVYFFLSPFIKSLTLKVIFIFLMLFVVVVVISSKILSKKLNNYNLYVSLKNLGAKEYQIFFVMIKDVGWKLLLITILLNLFFEVNLISLFPLYDKQLSQLFIFNSNIHYYIFSLMLNNQIFEGIYFNIAVLYGIISLMLLLIYQKSSSSND